MQAYFYLYELDYLLYDISRSALSKEFFYLFYIIHGKSAFLKRKSCLWEKQT
jgi:hypothetical protein